MAIKISESARQLKGAMQGEGEVKLPFAAPTCWVLNGNTQLAELKGARYFGGWAIHATEIDELGIAAPAGMVRHAFTPRSGNGEVIEVCSARRVKVACFGKRLSSVEKETGARYPGYRKGASPHLQVLAMLFTGEAKEKLTAWNPVVLSAKGFQAGYVLDAIQKWERITAKARREFAEGLDASAFICAIGTFGEKPEVKQVGTGKTSPINPITLYEPKEISEAALDALYVGESVVDQMITLRAEATDWLNAWKIPVKAKETVYPSELEHNAPEGTDEETDDLMA